MNIVYVPCKSEQEAKKIAKELVSQKLAFCTNIIGSIDSVYLWKGKVEESSETLLIVKTTKELVDPVIKRIKALHSYDLPDIVSWEIDKTTLAVKKWCKNELK